MRPKSTPLCQMVLGKERDGGLGSASREPWPGISWPSPCSVMGQESVSLGRSPTPSAQRACRASTGPSSHGPSGLGRAALPLVEPQFLQIFKGHRRPLPGLGPQGTGRWQALCQASPQQGALAVFQLPNALHSPSFRLPIWSVEWGLQPVGGAVAVRRAPCLVGREGLSSTSPSSSLVLARAPPLD